VFLEEGEPLVFGKDMDKGIRMNGQEPEVVALGNGVKEDELIVHRESMENTAYAYMLSRMEDPGMPLPFGILRCVEKPSYNQMLSAQISTAVEESGTGDLSDLYSAADTWTVET